MVCRHEVCADDACGGELTGASPDAVYCSSACRQRSYRRRQKMVTPYGGDWHAASAPASASLDQIIRVADKAR